MGHNGEQGEHRQLRGPDLFRSPGDQAATAESRRQADSARRRARVAPSSTPFHEASDGAATQQGGNTPAQNEAAMRSLQVPFEAADVCLTLE